MPSPKNLPYIPLYVGDWKKNLGLQTLSREDRMIFLEIIFFLWESDERGYLVLNGTAITEEVLTNMLNLLEQKGKTCLTNFFALGLLARREGDGAIYWPDLINRLKLSEMRKNAGKSGGLANQKNILLKQKSSKKGKIGSANAEVEITYHKLYLEREDKDKSTVFKYFKEFSLKSEDEFNEKFEKYVALMNWIDEFTPQVNKLEQPIRFKEFLKLQQEFTKDRLLHLLRAMNNYPPLLKKNSHAYQTIANWDRMDQERLGKKPDNSTADFKVIDKKQA